MPVEERGLRCRGMPKGCKPAGVASAYYPAFTRAGRRSPEASHAGAKESGRPLVGGSAPSGREQACGASERSTAGEAVQLLKAGGTQNLRSRCDRHGWKRLRTGVPCARCMLPLESWMRETRTSSSVSRGWKRTYDDGLTHRCESGRKTLRTLRAPRHLLTLRCREAVPRACSAGSHGSRHAPTCGAPRR